MKEIIVVANKAFLNATDFVCIEDVVKDLKVEYTKEQLPETFEDLKELCEGTKEVGVFTECISCNKLLFWSNGEISSETDDGEEIVYIENRTPAQMWQIIKNLIGENNE